MKRRHFIALASGGLAMSVFKLDSISNLGEHFFKKQGKAMPSLFIGHGSPMNAIEENSFTRFLNSLGKKLEPQAILCISAHWMTRGTWVTHMEKPKTIHDFGGFPQTLFDVQYPALGSPSVAQYIRSNNTNIQLDDSQWGLDHGTWAVLKQMYPDANIPVVQLSLDMTQGPEYHLKLGEELSKLRERGVLILGSGNIVHNLGRLQWQENAAPYDWAVEFNQWTKDRLLNREFESLASDFLKTEAGRLSVPSMDHYYPMLYVLGASAKRDELKLEYEEIQSGSISMLSFSFGHS